ncbi:hypothetical protein [Burkholderia sp. BCC0322]|uniref:hypothetical protein n=1 Tax=unclassified Burkholderia TaxID=2613784 RepID=UPI001589E690|nr:hypothetical protein [Burkholderia sp. BCC0322]
MEIEKNSMPYEASIHSLCTSISNAKPIMRHKTMGAETSKNQMLLDKFSNDMQYLPMPTPTAFQHFASRTHRRPLASHSVNPNYQQSEQKNVSFATPIETINSWKSPHQLHNNLETLQPKFIKNEQKFKILN